MSCANDSQISRYALCRLLDLSLLFSAASFRRVVLLCLKAGDSAGKSTCKPAFMQTRHPILELIASTRLYQAMPSTFSEYWYRNLPIIELEFKVDRINFRCLATGLGRGLGSFTAPRQTRWQLRMPQARPGNLQRCQLVPWVKQNDTS